MSEELKPELLKLSFNAVSNIVNRNANIQLSSSKQTNNKINGVVIDIDEFNIKTEQNMENI